MNSAAAPPQTNSPGKSRIGAARVGYFGRLTSTDGVPSNNDRVAALTHMPMPIDIKELRNLLEGLSYYHKFLSKIAIHSNSPPSWRTPFASFSRISYHCRSSSSPVRTRSPTNSDPSAFTATLAPLASEPLSSRNNAMAPCAPLPTSTERRLPMSKSGHLWN